MSRRLLLLIAGALAGWLLLVLPARQLGGGDEAVLFGGTAVLLCLLPAALTLVWAEHAFRDDPRQAPLVVLGGTGVRMVVVFLAGLALYLFVPFYQQRNAFLLWLVVFYLIVLALEMGILLGPRPGRERSSPPEA